MQQPKQQHGRVGLFLFATTIVCLAQATAPAGRYIITNTTIADTVTGLLWERIGKNSSKAEEYCAALRLEGQGGWRLPTMPELRTILDVRGGAEFEPAPMSNPLRFWSSTGTWWLDFNDGRESRGNGANYVRCVK